MLYTKHKMGRHDERLEKRDIDSLNTLLDKIELHADNNGSISIRDILVIINKRWFGPILVVTGLIMLTPVIGDIPGVPVLMGWVVILVSIQLLGRRKSLWLPDWVQCRSLNSEKVKTAVKWFRKPSALIDKVTYPRLQWAVGPAGILIIAMLSIMIASITPILEFIPFSAVLAGLAISAFGISILARDGVLAVIATFFSLGTFYSGYTFLINANIKIDF